MGRADVYGLIRELDGNGDGVLTRQEFVKILEEPIGGGKGYRVIKDVRVDRPLEVEEMLLDMKVKMKYMRE